MQSVKPRKLGKAIAASEPPFPGMISLPLKKTTFLQLLYSIGSTLEANPAEPFDLFCWQSEEIRNKLPNFRVTDDWIEAGWTSIRRGTDGKTQSKTLPFLHQNVPEIGFFFGFCTSGWSITIIVTDYLSTREMQEPVFTTWVSSDPTTISSALHTYWYGEKIDPMWLELSNSGSRFQLITNLLEHFNESNEHRDFRILWSDRMNSFANSIAWELDLGKLLPVATDRFKEAINFDFFELQLFDRDKQKFVERFTWRRNDTKYGGKMMTLELQTSILRAIYRHRHAVLISDLIKEDAVLNPKLLFITELKSAVILPLVYERRVHGILKLFFRETNRVNDRDLEWLSDMAELFTRSLANARLFSSLSQMASVDGLTGVNNRRAFSDQLSREFKRFQRFGVEVALMMIDVDHFKIYNDREGHLQGDQVLRGIADLLKRSVRETDFVARYGGEEFAIILPGASMEGASALADKLRFIVETFSFVNAHKQPEGHITISIGLSCTTVEVKSPEELIHLADMALYQAKQNGRNRVYLCQGAGEFVPMATEENKPPDIDTIVD